MLDQLCNSAPPTLGALGCSGVTLTLVDGWAVAQTAGSGITSLGRLPRGFSRRRARRASRSEDLRGRAVREGSGGKLCRLLDVDGWIAWFGEDECHRLGGEVAALHEPFVVLL